MKCKFIVCVLFCLSFGINCSNVKAEGKIHMIFVWGTNEVATNRFVVYSKNKIQKAFEGQGGIGLSRYSSGGVEWSDYKFRPGIGDRIVNINGQLISDLEDFNYAIANSPTEVTLRIADTKNGGYYTMKSRLNPVGSYSRFGLYTTTDPSGGVRVLRHMEGYPCTLCSTNFYSNGSTRGSSDVATYRTITGSDATPANILRTIKKVSDNAGENDAVMVYILCHGLSVDVDEGRKHLLLPGIKKCDLNSIERDDVLVRSDVFDALTSSRHRLNVLITDSCSTLADIELPLFPTAAPPPDNSLLKVFLLNSRGTLNVNSSDPNGGPNEDGERALAWLPSSGDSDFAGTVFTNAFIFTSSINVGKDKINSVTPEMFYANLKNELKGKYKKLYAMLKEAGDTAVREIASQETQTLTAFRPDGTTDNQLNSRSFSEYSDWSGGVYNDEREDIADTTSDEGVEWSDYKFRPGIGDRIVNVNGQSISDLEDFNYAIANSPTEVTLRIADTKNGGYYTMKSRLNPVGSDSRFGLYVTTDPSGGVRVLRHMEGYPCTRCSTDFYSNR